IPYLGGQTRAEQYLQKHQQVYNTSKIGVWHCDDLLVDQPLGRVLFLGYSQYGDLYASSNLYYDGRFLGVRRGANGVSIAPEAHAHENPSLDAVMNALKPLYR
ncbi:MAG: hypothetical protein Q8R47_05020, partial [Nanoarchaeota archaeon]|nr:hypothetical protein [Nanoarchaeota archaeon]